MYLWRKLSDDESKSVLRERKGHGLPWHRPPHRDFVGPVTFIITAACYEHQHIIGKNLDRIGSLETTLLSCCKDAGAQIFAWCILPNHYHLLVRTDNIKHLRKKIGKVHGRTATKWNREDELPERKVWFNFFDRDMRSNRHYWATKNYIHNNAVHHGYVERWQDWPYSSVHQYLDEVGRTEALRIWREFPVLDYGKNWDVY
jgi:putative transposase